MALELAVVEQLGVDVEGDQSALVTPLLHPVRDGRVVSRLGFEDVLRDPALQHRVGDGEAFEPAVTV